MGQRARGKGIANAALRAARAAAREHDEVAAKLAQRVYQTAVDLRDERDALGVVHPVVQAAAEMAAPGVARLNGMDPRDPALVADIAAYLVSGFREMVAVLNVEHFTAWRAATDRAEMGLGSPDVTTTEEGLDDGSSHDA